MTNQDCKNLEKSKNFSCRIYHGACGCEDDCPNYEKEKIEMNIPEIIKEHHQAMIDKGFYDCPNCIGVKDEEPMVMAMLMNNCSLCHDSRIDPNKNIGELLMLIVSELGEALEAHRNNRFADWNDYIDDQIRSQWPIEKAFEFQIKDTFEDEIADTKLRIFDLMGYLKVSYNPNDIRIVKWKSDNVAQRIKQLCQYFINLDEDYIDSYELSKGLGYIDQFAKSLNIDLEKYILAKMEYNKTRPHKHGKEY